MTYLSAKSFENAAKRFSELAERYAGYDAEEVWGSLHEAGSDEKRVLPYLLFPLDARWLYYETKSRLLNRPRPELTAEELGLRP